ncbi:hypothetical protein BOTBODRAFT_122308, partial [Botryobasidium botryosum FD-172 SS1]
ALGTAIGFPNLPILICSFLFKQLNLHNPCHILEVHPDECPGRFGYITVFPSAVATFCAPSDDYSGTTEMTQERICATPSWHGGAACYDGAFLKKKGAFGALGMQALEVGLLLLCACAVVSNLGDQPNPDMGLWVIEPAHDDNGSPIALVVHIHLLVWNAHLMPVFGSHFVPKSLHFFHSLDAFCSFFVNKYINHQATQLAY